MGRSFTARDLIVLPRLSADDAVVLMKELQTAAAAEAAKLEKKTKKLPDAIERSRLRLTAAHTALDAATAPQLVKIDTQAKRKADRALDNAWSASFDWLSGWCKLPPEKNTILNESRALFDVAFPDALSFTKLPYKLQWKESQSRLDAIAKGKLEGVFKELGGEAFLKELKETHDVYGRVLHITAPKPAEPAPTNVGALLEAARDALRDYAKRAAAHADPDVPGSDALSEALLKPLVMWESRAASATGEEEGAEEPAAEPEQVPEGGSEKDPKGG